MEKPSAVEAGLRRDQVAITGYFRAALSEVSIAIGGEDLAAEIEELPTDANSMWPVNALRLLESRQAGAAETAFARAEALQVEAHTGNA